MLLKSILFIIPSSSFTCFIYLFIFILFCSQFLFEIYSKFVFEDDDESVFYASFLEGVPPRRHILTHRQAQRDLKLGEYILE